jgi:CTP-dependent riboflavin kinase
VASKRHKQQIDASEGRYARYVRELKDMLYEAERLSDSGQWGEVANQYQAIVAHSSALVGVARELNLLVLLYEEG